MADEQSKHSKENKLPLEDVVGIDSILHSPPRLAIMIFLLPRLKATYSSIQKALKFTSGNLTAHLNKLEKSKMIVIQKGFVKAQPTTIIYLTDFGKERLREYAEILVNVLEQMLKEE
jgi:DNA-binding MarR family transcriptional regulator